VPIPSEPEPIPPPVDISGALYDVFMQAPVPLVLLTGPEHRVTFINPPYVRLMRRTSDDLIVGRPIREVLPELEGQGFFELLDQVYRTGEPYIGREVPGTLLREDTGRQEEAFFDFVYQPIRRVDGQISGIMSQANDVTESVKMRLEGERREQILHSQWSELESIYRTAPVGLALFHSKTYVFLRANDVQGKMNGWPASELIGKSVREIAPALADGVEALFRQVVAGKPVVAMQIGGEVPHEPGVHHDWIVSYFPIYADDGTVEAISCVTLDVTAQRQAEAALRESEARLRAIYSTSLEYIGLLSPEGIILDCNRTALQFADIVYEDVLGVHFAESPWFIYTPGGPELCRQAIARALAGEVVRMEAPLRRPSGEVMTFDFSLSPFRNAEGEIEFLVPEGRDITDLKRVQSALIQSEKLAAVGRLASSVAHEINNPLESVTNLIFLARQHAISKQTQELLDIAEQELQRVSVIANQTLRFHKQATKPLAVRCTELFASVLRIYDGRLRNAHIAVEKERLGDEEVICFQGDIRQVLLNLVGNAVDAMPAGGRLLIRSRVSTDWKTGRRGLTLAVADTGMGIDPADRGSIFEPFFTTKGFSGTGLGLWISLEIMERHEGRIQIRSRLQRGTVVGIFLPFREG